MNAPLCPYGVRESPRLCGGFTDPQEIELDVRNRGLLQLATTP